MDYASAFRNEGCPGFESCVSCAASIRSRVMCLCLGSGSRDATLPFTTRGNYCQPLDILATFFAKADAGKSRAKHNRYLEIPGFDPLLVTRDPEVIRAVLTATGVGEG